MYESYSTLIDERNAMLGFDPSDYNQCINAIKMDSNALRYVKDQTEDMCLMAVSKYGLSLEYVKRQTEKICLAAVKENGWAIEFVKNQTDMICLAAVQQNPYAIKYVKNQTEEICKAALIGNPISIKFIKNQTEELCVLAVSLNGYALYYINNQTPSICKTAVKQSKKSLLYVKDLSMLLTNIDTRNTIKAEINIGINPGYNHNNEMVFDFENYIQKLVQSNEFINDNLSFIVYSTKSIYKEQFGCPANGEDTYMLTTIANRKFVTDIDKWKESILRFVEYLKNDLKQSTVTFDFCETEMKYFTNHL